MSEFARRFDPAVRGTGGPVLFTRVWKHLQKRPLGRATLANLTVLSHATFNPLHWWQPAPFYEPEGAGAPSALVPGVTVAVHLWSSVRDAAQRPWRPDSFAARLVRDTCGAAAFQSVTGARGDAVI